MPLPTALSAMMTDPVFWACYLLDDEFEGDRSRYEKIDDMVVRFPVTAGGFGLLLEMSSDLWFHELRLLTPESAQGGLLGWDDGAHFHPHVFRWEEFDLICRAMALTEPDLRYPGPAAALLVRFAFLSEAEHLDGIAPVVEASLHATRPRQLGWHGYWPDTQGWLRWRDLRDCEISWRREGGFIAADQPMYGPRLPLYTLRRRSAVGRVDAEFPFHDWDRLLGQAEALLAGVVDPQWREDPGIRSAISKIVAGDLDGAAPLAALLEAAGCRNAVVIRALREPVHPVETLWVLELLAGAHRGDWIAAHCGAGARPATPPGPEWTPSGMGRNADRH